MKTLKDLYEDKDSDMKCCEYECQLKIREAAKEWLKKTDMEIFEEMGDLINDGDYNDVYMIRFWVKHFFNLKEKEGEEDVK